MVPGDHQGSAGQDMYHVQKGRGRIRGRRKTMYVWEIMSNSVWLEDIICGGKLDCKAGEKVRNWVIPGFVVPGVGIFCPWKSEDRASVAGGNGVLPQRNTRKAFPGSMPGRMKVSGRTYWG